MHTSQTRQTLPISLQGVPAVIALLAVWVEPSLTKAIPGHIEMLPLATLLVVAILVHPRLRHLMMITLCYGVSFLALRDIARLSQVQMPDQLRYQGWDVVRSLLLLAVAGLAATAAIVETREPGTVWARRCYFGAATLYFLGLGVINLLWHPSWQALLLCVTGVTAGMGCVFAHRIVATEAEEQEADQPSDEALQQAREAAHRARLQAKEWRDTLVLPRDEQDPTCMGPV